MKNGDCGTHCTWYLKEYAIKKKDPECNRFEPNDCKAIAHKLTMAFLSNYTSFDLHYPRDSNVLCEFIGNNGDGAVYGELLCEASKNNKKNEASKDDGKNILQVWVDTSCIYAESVRYWKMDSKKPYVSISTNVFKSHRDEKIEECVKAFVEQLEMLYVVEPLGKPFVPEAEDKLGYVRMARSKR